LSGTVPLRHSTLSRFDRIEAAVTAPGKSLKIDVRDAAGGAEPRATT
jgi:hypothetical protein